MNENPFAKAEFLRDQNNYGLGDLPIPSGLDEQITRLLREWRDLDAARRMEALLGISEAQRFTLIGYGERMASLAVRSGEKEYIVLGLLALGLDGWHGDWRDNTTVVPLHYDAARRIGVDPADPFDEASALLPKKPADALRAFLRRTEADKSLAAMGYVAGSDRDGFRYGRTW